MKASPMVPEGHPRVEVFSPAAAPGLPETEVGLVVDDGLQGLVDGDAGRFHLGQSSHSVLIGKERRIFSDLKNQSRPSCV
uniref:Uncharacterized protein n=1 Tax=Anguilla anguilla TaxID=7936 RepID=A0A0E9R3X4_ANGAN